MAINKKIKTLIAFIIVLVILAIIIVLWYRKTISNIEIPSTKKEQIINFGKQNKKLFILAKAWGVAGNHEEIVLSTNHIEDGKQYSKDECFVFYTAEIYYKIQGLDTLYVYADESSWSEKPKNFNSSIKIIQIGLKNYDEASDYNINYKKYGLSKISVN